MSRSRAFILATCFWCAASTTCTEDTGAVRQAHIESLKKEILLKLQIPIPPNVSATAIDPKVLAEYTATVAAQSQVNKALRDCAQYGRYSKELFVYFPANHSQLPERKLSKRGYEFTIITPLSADMKQQRVVFELDLRGKEAIASAELRLFKVRTGPSGAPVALQEHVVVKQVNWPPEYYEGVPMITYVASKLVNTEAGYEVFNVTSALLEWVSLKRDDPRGTFELEVTVSGVEPSANYTPTIGFVLESAASSNGTSTQLVVAGYESRQRQRRNVRPAINSTECLSRPPTSCCLRNLVVDFHRDLGFTWILQPTSYAINYCAGLCPWTVPQASQNALLLAYANDRNPTASPQPCCAPDLFHPLTIIVQRYDSQNPSSPPIQEVQLIPDLVVQQCICR